MTLNEYEEDAGVSRKRTRLSTSSSAAVDHDESSSCLSLSAPESEVGGVAASYDVTGGQGGEDATTFSNSVDADYVRRESSIASGSKEASNAMIICSSNLKKFSKEEDDLIMEGFSKFGARWDDIVHWGNMNRTASQLRGRFNRMIKSQLENKSVAHGSGIMSPISMPSLLVSPFNNVAISAGTSGIDVSNNTTSASASASPAPTIITASGNLSDKRSVVEDFESDLGIDKLPVNAKIQVYIQRIKSLEHVERAMIREKSLRADLERQNLELVNIIKSLKSEAAEFRVTFENQLSNIKEAFNSKLETMSSFYRTLLTEKAIQEAKKVRERLNEDSLRLASIRIERHGSEHRELIQEGYAFTELYMKQARVMEEKRAIDQKRKELVFRRSDQNLQLEEVQIRSIKEEEEILKVRYSSLKKRENELFGQHEALLREKELHLKEIRRVRDENASRFHSHPLMANRYLLLHLIGKGGFSEVYLAFDLVEFKEVACKIHQLTDSWSDAKKTSYMKHAIREYSIHKQLFHPRIIKLLDVFEIDDHSFCTVLEYCNGSDLEKMLQINSTFSEKEAKCIIVQVVSAIKYLNELDPPIIHFDLKPANILFDCGEVKITDFGLSKIMNNNDDIGCPGYFLTSPGAGTYWYLPPECFNNPSNDNPTRISDKVDVWSIGVILYQLIFGKKPFGNDLSQQDILRHDIIRNSYQVHFPAKPTISQECKNFIMKCLEHEQENRPDIKALWNDPFLLPKISSSLPKS